VKTFEFSYAMCLKGLNLCNLTSDLCNPILQSDR